MLGSQQHRLLNDSLEKPIETAERSASRAAQASQVPGIYAAGDGEHIGGSRCYAASVGDLSRASRWRRQAEYLRPILNKIRTPLTSDS